MTGLRFYAASLIVVDHTIVAVFPLFGLSTASGDVASRLGMTLFFVLSGFVIQLNYGFAVSGWRPANIANFLRARFARLYPLYALAVLLSFAYGFAIAPQALETTLKEAWPYYLTMTHDWGDWWIGDTRFAFLYAGGSWSLSAEIFLYLLFLALAPFVTRIRGVRAVTLCTAILAVSATFFTIANMNGVFGSYDYVWAYLSPYARAPEFLLGCLAAVAYTVEIPRRLIVARIFGVLGLVYVTLLTALLLVPAASSQARLFQMDWGYAPGVAAIIFALAVVGPKAVRLVEARPVILLGDASYSIYLLHPWVLWFFLHTGNAIQDWRSAVLKVAAAWIGTVLLALGAYRYFESPARRLIRGRGTSRDDAAAVVCGVTTPSDAKFRGTLPGTAKTIVSNAMPQPGAMSVPGP